MTARKRPGEETLPELVRDTPTHPLAPLDERMVRYLSDQESMPPPPPGFEERRDSLVEKIQQISRSGSWDIRAILAENKGYYERAMAIMLGEERRLHEKERADKLEAAEDRRTQRREDIVDGVIKTVAASGVIALVVVLGRLLLLK